MPSLAAEKQPTGVVGADGDQPAQHLGWLLVGRQRLVDLGHRGDEVLEVPVTQLHQAEVADARLEVQLAGLDV